MSELYELTVADAATQIKTGKLSPLDLTKSILDRIRLLEPKLKAWVYLDEDAVLKDAKKKEEDVAAGNPIGPLHGVPIGLKDIYYTASIPTTACSKVYADFVPEYDATTVTSLKQAGAIILGKTVTTEFACGDPSPTINPWNSAHTPGGSSSGSAVSVASRMCPAALGSQTVGSVLRPASYNGVVGFKPTLGRVSRFGVIPVSWTLDTMGWMTRTVSDAAILLSVMAGHDKNDPISSGAEVPEYLEILTSEHRPRIGILREFFLENADDETEKHFLQVVKLLTDSGANVVELAIPESFSTVISDQQTVMAVEGAAFHRPMYEGRSEDYRPKIRSMIQRGIDTDAVSYSYALERRLQFVADMAGLVHEVDVLMTPSTPTPALPDVTNTGNTMFQGPWTYCGLPAITIPSGLSASGMPLGIQLASGNLQESLLLSSAKWCESALNVELRPNI